jgi:hypothetical protein
MRHVALAATAIFFGLVLVGCAKESLGLSCDDLPGRAVALLPSPHIATVHSSHIPYNSVPPTSGPHVPWVLAPGIYEEDIPEELQPHPLEHGHILIQYAPSLPSDEIGELERFVAKYPRDVIVAPYSRLKSGIALTAWGRIETLEHPDAARIERFVLDLRNRYDHSWRAGASECPPEPTD